jgi:hypothetical protein
MHQEAKRTAHDVFRQADRGALFYSLTPPRRETPADRADEIARTTLARLASLTLDALVLYDVDAEQDRTAEERPFPFVPMMDPSVFLDQHLRAWCGPVVVYRAVGKYPGPELSRWLRGADASRLLTVFVGSSSSTQEMRTSLEQAYALRTSLAPGLGSGAVAIAERHAKRGDEHERMLRKQSAGATFFVSQVCYDLDHTRNMLSDYAYTCRRRGIAPVPVVLTLAPCGSGRTLEFMSWLGIDVPTWVRNDILMSEDPLAVSFEQCLAAARVLSLFCRRLELPFGINVESLTIRRVEIEASVELAMGVHELLGRS